MTRIMLAMILLCLSHACRERMPVDDTVIREGDPASEDQLPAVDDASDPAPSEPEPKMESMELPTSPASPGPASSPAPVILVKAAAKYNEFCSFAKKLETTESAVRLSTEGFGFKPDASMETLQCLVTLDATIPKGRRLVPVILPQSYFTGLGMFASGQSLQVDMNILTLAGDAIEASLEYQAVAMGPIANDTEFVRTMQLMRRITPVCQLKEEVKRTLVIMVILTVNKGSSLTYPPVMTRELPRVDYIMESCTA